MPTRRGILLAIALVLPSRFARAQAGVAEPVFAERGLAIRGHDPVAYFRHGRRRRGEAAFTHAWRGATWRFASAANRDAFAAEPERFAPQYGGFCAFAVAGGYAAPIDPAAWTIVDGRLYLNYDRAVQRRWEADIAGHIARGDANWSQVAAQLRGR
jgi:YHS domain-containing protein